MVVYVVVVVWYQQFRFVFLLNDKVAMANVMVGYYMINNCFGMKVRQFIIIGFWCRCICKVGYYNFQLRIVFYYMGDGSQCFVVCIFNVVIIGVKVDYWQKLFGYLIIIGFIGFILLQLVILQFF